jgi:hypothetical protein
MLRAVADDRFGAVPTTSHVTSAATNAPITTPPTMSGRERDTATSLPDQPVPKRNGPPDHRRPVPVALDAGGWTASVLAQLRVTAPSSTKNDVCKDESSVPVHLIVTV